MKPKYINFWVNYIILKEQLILLYDLFNGLIDKKVLAGMIVIRG